MTVELRPVLMFALCLAAGALSSCASVPWATASCHFAYSEEFRQAVTIRELKRQLGDHWQFYDDPTPAVLVRGSKVRVILQHRDPNILDSGAFVIERRDCGRTPVTAQAVRDLGT